MSNVLSTRLAVPAVMQRRARIADMGTTEQHGSTAMPILHRTLESPDTDASLRHTRIGNHAQRRILPQCVGAMVKVDNAVSGCSIRMQRSACSHSIYSP